MQALKMSAMVHTKEPVRQGLVSMTGTFWDTVVICLLTGLVNPQVVRTADMMDMHCVIFVIYGKEFNGFVKYE